ncbi:hypothetical protein AVEN_111305-1 [Araneus ventricosus]|uniref:Uncharacterized protein n=1 Tax=Araneus ventricosus TaxID=182803 RepID=A0A4Y2GH68_ARAVE|nr:hypothetical protein AVEN_111305-1 [Araneus ventricosus]
MDRHYWVKAHIGIVGNEKADGLSKAGTEKNELDFNVGIPKSWIKSRLIEMAHQNRQERWENSLEARYTFELIPKIDFKRCMDTFLPKPTI